MLLQLFIGSLLTVGTIVVGTVISWGIEVLLKKVGPWAHKPPYGPHLMTVLALTLLGTLMMMTVAVWAWAVAFLVLGVFEDLESSVYFSLVSFTTLGFGDVLLPKEWRLLGGLAAANGLLLFGLLTAILVETMRLTRLRQKDERH